MCPPLSSEERKRERVVAFRKLFCGQVEEKIKLVRFLFFFSSVSVFLFLFHSFSIFFNEPVWQQSANEGKQRIWKHLKTRTSWFALTYIWSKTHLSFTYSKIHNVKKTK